MPCSDGGPSLADEIAYRKDRQIKNMDKELEVRDSLLCSACRVLERIGYDFEENPRLSEWWDEHKKEDQKREKEEAKKRLNHQLAIELSKKPVSQLTKEDKALLKKEGFL